MPYETTKQRLFMMTGVVVEIETIQKCQSASSSCQQLPRMVTFYKGTEFETTVDVGMCSGVHRKYRMPSNKEEDKKHFIAKRYATQK